MANERGFIEFAYVENHCQSVEQRIKHFDEFIDTLTDKECITQASRCMDCGIPFCSHRCPLHNNMPDFNRFVVQGNWEKAYESLIATNDFPEITGRICPALCQESCCLGLYQDKEVGIKSIERKIMDYAYENGLVKDFVIKERIGKKVAIVGSGPAALACAIRLNRLGVDVTVFEKMDKIGGLLRYGIPDFKLEKGLLDRKINQMQREGVKFVTSTLIADSKNLETGVHNDATAVVDPNKLYEDFDAIVLAIGSETPRDLKIEGRNLKGIYFALDFLIAQNKENNGDGTNPIDVKGKKVVVIGGGETASDCIGVSIRKGAKSVTQLDYHEELPTSVKVRDVWPDIRHIKHTSTSQEEGCTRLFSTNTVAFNGKEHLESINTVKVRWEKDRKIIPIEGTEGCLDADVALIAMGYQHPCSSVFKSFNLELAPRGNFMADLNGNKAFYSSKDKVFVTGDSRKGQSLVVYALAEGRDCAMSVYRYLTK